MGQNRQTNMITAASDPADVPKTAVILAGGYSSRMGVNKAELKIREKTLLEIQAEKVRSAGISEILVSGYLPKDQNLRFVPDIYPHKGPLSGIHAGLQASGSESCLVLCIDMPLIPEETLKALMKAHQGGITVLSHRGWIEPLCGVYDRSLVPLCEQVLRTDNTSVRQLMKQAGYREYMCDLDERYLLNCNTPEEYRRVCSVFEEMSEPIRK